MGEAVQSVNDAARSPDASKRGVGLATSAIVVVALVADTLLIVAGIRGVALLPLVGAHLLVVLAMVLCLQRRIRAGTDGGLALLAVIGTLATGPFGAAGLLLMPSFTRGNTTSEALLAAWYDRIALSAEQDNFTKLSDRVAIGRAANLAAPPPQPFYELFRTGPIAEQQIALGMIARGFHPGYLPVLKIALDSPQPVIRVQAAAVAARVRGQLNAHVETLFTRASDPTLSASDALDVAAELRASVGSGLLEASQQTTASRVLEGLFARVFARLDARRRGGTTAQALPVERTTEDVDDAYAGQLLAQGRFAEFRSLRLAARRPLHGRYRHRLVRARRASSAYVKQLRPVVARV